jgi:hypothetical protein
MKLKRLFFVRDKNCHLTDRNSSMYLLGHITDYLSEPRLSEEVGRLPDVLACAAAVGMINGVHGDASDHGPQTVLRFGFMVHVTGFEQSHFEADAAATTPTQPRHRLERIFIRMDVG